MPSVVAVALQAHKQEQIAERASAPYWEMQWGDLVFSTETGGPLHGPTVTRRF